MRLALYLLQESQSYINVDHKNTCEIKRLYVRKRFRGLGLGRSMTHALMERGSRVGYSSMLLETLAHMTVARELYASLGFIDVPPYHVSRIQGAHYLKAPL